MLEPMDIDLALTMDEKKFSDTRRLIFDATENLKQALEKMKEATELSRKQHNELQGDLQLVAIRSGHMISSLNKHTSKEPHSRQK